MSESLEIRQLSPDDADALIALRQEALASDPLSFGASTQDDKALSADFLRTSLADARKSAVFGLFAGTALVGMVGLVRLTELKRRHKAVIWGMYITPHARGRGAGRRLLETAIGHARTWPETGQIHLSVTAPSVEAHRLYESAGFREWGREPCSLHWEGRFVDEVHMILELAPSPQG